MAKMAKGGFSRATMEEMQYLIKKPHAEVEEESNWGDEFLGRRKVKAAIGIHPAMVHDHNIDSCLPCKNGTAKRQQTRWRSIRTGAPQSDRCRK